MAFVAFIAFLVLMFGFVISFISGNSLVIFDTIYSYVDAIIYYLGQAIDIVWLFVPKTIAVTCMQFAIGAYLLKYVYKFAMWVLKKIPFLHIS